MKKSFSFDDLTNCGQSHVQKYILASEGISHERGLYSDMYSLYVGLSLYFHKNIEASLDDH